MRKQDLKPQSGQRAKPLRLPLSPATKETIVAITVIIALIVLCIAIPLGSLELIDQKENPAGLYQAQCGLASFTFERVEAGGTETNPVNGNRIYLSEACVFERIGDVEDEKGE